MAFNLQSHIELTQVESRQDTSLGIMRWGTNNSFPQTLKNLIEQSPSAKTAVSRTAKFYKGAGFDGEDEIINPYGLTLKGLVSILADDLALYGALAIHSNYNLKGKVGGMNPMRIAELRYKEFDELNFSSKIGYHSNFSRNAVVKKTITNTVTKDKIRWFNRFNPEAFEDQLALVKGKKLGNYSGQILYESNDGHSSYPIPPLQAAINYVLSDIENSILLRKESATGFINSYIFKTTLDSEDPTLNAIENAFAEAQGARGSGKIITLSGLSPEDLSTSVLEEISGGDRKGVVEAVNQAYELAQRVISGAYLIPPALAGADMKQGFSGADLEEAYFVFNAVTQPGRDTIESSVNRVLKNSSFNTKEIKIKKLKLDLGEKDPTGQEINNRK